MIQRPSSEDPPPRPVRHKQATASPAKANPLQSPPSGDNRAPADAAAKSGKIEQLSFNIPYLKATSHLRPEGFVDSVLQQGKIQGDTIILEPAARKSLRKRFPPTADLRLKVAALKADSSPALRTHIRYILAHGRMENDEIILDAHHRRELRRRFALGTHPPPGEPTLAELASNFTQAMAGWARAGFKLVERDEFERRHGICLSCEHWQPDARSGMGKCKICGCSKLKLWLATSKCPYKPPKWLPSNVGQTAASSGKA